MSVLVDTNVLLRRIQPGHLHQAAAIKSVRTLLTEGKSTHFTLQNISEFWNVATRPVANNGLGFSIGTAFNEIEKIEGSLTLLPDTSETYTEWKRLVVRHGVMGVKVHDARLVAVMNVYKIDRLLTFNVDDFTRYGIDAMHPASL